jgi:muramoyltetrapeptide carboxypeptidase
LSPSSKPDRQSVEDGIKVLQAWGLVVELGEHAYDEYGHFLAGRDQDRLGDFNNALRDPGVRAIFTSTGGKGAYRIAHALDFAACQKDPKPVIGFSDTTILHLALWQQCRLVGFHGPHIACNRFKQGKNSAEELRGALMEPRPIVIHQNQHELTAQVLIEGKTSGILMGGNLNLIGKSVGWACPSFSGAILLIEAIDTFIGQIDSTLTQLRRAGYLDGLKGIVVGQFIRSADPKPGKWSVIDVLYDHLNDFGVPVLGGIPVGHGLDSLTVPLGTKACLDTAARALTIESGVE